MNQQSSVSARINAIFGMIFYILLIVFLVKVLQTGSKGAVFANENFCNNLTLGWRIFAIMLIILAILGFIGALITLILG